MTFELTFVSLPLNDQHTNNRLHVFQRPSSFLRTAQFRGKSSRNGLHRRLNKCELRRVELNSFLLLLLLLPPCSSPLCSMPHRSLQIHMSSLLFQVMRELPLPHLKKIFPSLTSLRSRCSPSSARIFTNPLLPPAQESVTQPPTSL